MSTVERADMAILATDSTTLAMGLGALLLSIPPIKYVQRVADVGALLDSLAENQPALLIIDTTLIGPQIIDLLQTIQAMCPRALRVLLSDNMVEFRELVYVSQDTVIIKGTDPGRLARTIEYLLHNSPVA